MSCEKIKKNKKTSLFTLFTILGKIVYKRLMYKQFCSKLKQIQKRKNMKRILGLLIVSFSIISCEKNKTTDEIININFLNNTWKVVEQTINSSPINPFINIKKMVNMDNNEILWIDTIYFGDSEYVFDTGFINTCFLLTENFGSFSGFWNYDVSQNKLNITHAIIMDSTWNRDTVVNGHRYSGYSFISNSYDLSS